MTFTPSRKRRASGFAQIPNDALRDEELTARARGVLAYMLSHSDGFEITRATLGRAFPEGRDAIETVLRELREAGYLRSVISHDAGGRFAGASYLVFDERGGAEAEAENDAENPEPGKPGVRDNRSPENPHAYKNTNSIKNTNTKEDQHLTLDSMFEDWWKNYPRKIGKGQARKAYSAAVKKLGTDLAKTQAVLLEALEAYAASVRAAGTEARFIVHASTWLNGERWLDEPETAPTGAQSAASRALSVDLGDSVTGGVIGPQIAAQAVRAVGPSIVGEMNGGRW